MSSKKEIVFTEEQLKSIREVREFVTDMFTPSWYYVFTGPAGSGKTACMMEVQKEMHARKLKVTFTAPTNKAAKVLRAVVGDAQTTYSFLNLRVAADGAVKRIAKGKDPDLSHLDVLVVDEASMVNAELFTYLQDSAQRWNFRVVFMGDSFQLPPVHEDESKALTGASSSSLSTVMRHDNQILRLATTIREQISLEKRSISLDDDNDGREGVWVLDPEDFKLEVFKAAQRGDFSDGEVAKVIAWRNAQVDHYNNIIRVGIFGNAAKPGYFLLNERITAGSPCHWGDIPLLHTDDGGTILDINERKHSKYTEFDVFELTVKSDFSLKTIALTVIHPNSKAKLDRHLALISDQAKKDPRMWKQFWDTKDAFHDVRYGYAETAHKSQGSTYREVYVDSSDIMRNRNREEAYRCFYVACTRPTTKLILT